MAPRRTRNRAVRRGPRARRAPWGRRPCPRRWRPPVQYGASHTGGRPRAGSDVAASTPAERRGRGRPRRARPAGCDATLPGWVRTEGSARLVSLLARHRTAIVRTPRDLDLVCPARQIVLTDLGVEELQLEEISAELLRHGGQMAPILLDVNCHHFGVQRRGDNRTLLPPVPIPSGVYIPSCSASCGCMDTLPMQYQR